VCSGLDVPQGGAFDVPAWAAPLYFSCIGVAVVAATLIRRASRRTQTGRG
jgi:hypothetical protein